MNSQAIQNKLNEYYNSATPEQIVKEFEDLGVEFVKTENMNLIQQLQTTPKWKEFEEWYNNFNGTKDAHDEQVYWEDLSIRKFIVLQFPFQKGVFEKFIETQSDYLITSISSELGIHSITVENDKFRKLFYSFEELLIWYFNN